MSKINTLKKELAKLRRDVKWNNEQIKVLKQDKTKTKTRIDELKAEIEKSDVTL